MRRRLMLALVFGLCGAGSALAGQPAVSNVDVLLGAHDVLHVAHMITTTYDLTRGGALGAREASPVLKPFSAYPLALASASSALDMWQVMVIKRIQPKHPRLAVLWAAGLVALEVWATTNNISAAGRIQQRMRAVGPR
jgi:hypothetical protein